MAGLLDMAQQTSGGGWDGLLADPGVLMGLSLIGGQGNIGARALQGVGLLGQQADSRQKRALTQAQLDNYQSEIKQRDAAQALAQQNAAGQRALEDKIFGGQARAATPGTADLNSLLPPELRIGALAPQAARAGGLGAASPDDLALLKLRFGKDLLPEYKFLQEGTKREAGAAYQMPDGRTVMGPPKVDNNMQLAQGQNGGWTTSAIPGATDAIAALKGAEAGATEEAKARLDPFTYTPEGGKPQLTTRGAMFGNQPQQPQVGGPEIRNADGAQLTPALQNLIRQDAQANGIQNPTANFGGAPRGASYGTDASIMRNSGPIPAGGSIPLQSEAEKRLQVGQAENVVGAGAKINDAWLKNSFEPAVAAGQAAMPLLESTQVARNALRAMGGTGWGTESRAGAASVLSGLGIAPGNAKMFAANAEQFQNAAMTRLQAVLNAAKGPQTEGDSTRAQKTYASLGNTTQANEFILDMAQASAERDMKKAQFYNEALPIAKQSGDLLDVERAWQKRAPSIFDMPSMQRWKGAQ